jgi:hypothetical protein
MSTSTLTQLRDTDLQILSDLDDKSLFNICLTNKYLNNICKNEDFWRNRFNKRFFRKSPERFFKESSNIKPENETWRHFYMRRIYEEGLVIGELERKQWRESPFYPNDYNIPVANTAFFTDKYDNWLLFQDSTLRENYLYISSLQSNGERIRIGFEKYKGIMNMNMVKRFDGFDLYTWAGKEYPKINITQVLTEFLEKKGKLFWLTSRYDENSINDFDNTVVSKISLEMKSEFFREKEEQRREYEMLNQRNNDDLSNENSNDESNDNDNEY